MKIKQALYTAMRFNFLFADRYVFRRGWVYPESYIPYNMVRYIIQGEAVFRIDGKEINVREGQVIYIPEGCLLACETLGEYFEFYSVRFRLSTQLTAGDFLSDYFHISSVTEVADDKTVLGYFQEIYANATSDGTGKMFRIRGNLELIVAWLAEHSEGAVVGESELPEAGLDPDSFWRRERHTSQNPQDPRIRVVVDYLISHPSDKVDEEFLSRLAGISQTTLRRLFKQQNGKTISEYIIELRMCTAARRLLTTDKPISAIAYEVGYDNPNYFSRVFRSYFGAVPNVYRKNART